MRLPKLTEMGGNMRTFRSFEALPGDAFKNQTAVAIGKFDGLHLGHCEILQRLVEVSAAAELESCVFTFTENPLATLAPQRCPRPLASTEQRVELLAAAGVSAAVMVDFTRELASMTPAEFARDVLASGLRAKIVLIGADFRFGRNGEGDAALLEQLGIEYGFQVMVVADVEVMDQRVSSTRIRELLTAGDVTTAARFLGRSQSVRGLVVHGAARGREIGFPTANLQPHYEGFAPCDGVYAGVAKVLGRCYAAAISIGGNPTFTPDAPSQIEVYILDFEGEIYGEMMTLYFVERLRGMTAYRGIDALVKQIQEDVDKTAFVVKHLL